MVMLNAATYDRDQVEFPGAYRVREMVLVSDQNPQVRHDISALFIQFDVFESVWSPTISGQLVMVDTTNMIKNVPILGEETLHVTITDGTRDMTLRMRVYAIKDRQHVRHGVLQYTLALCSEEMWLDSFVRISQSYHLKKFEDNVRTILQNHLRSQKPIITGATKDIRSVVIPYWSPIHAITWMGNRAQAAEDTYSAGNFVFFETIDGFKWVAVDNLLDSTVNRPYCTLFYDPMRPSVQGLTRYDRRMQGATGDALMIEEWSVVKSFDFLDNARNGMYANRTRTIDIVNRTWQDTDQNYFQQFYDTPHLKGLDGAAARPFCSYKNEAPGWPEAHMRVAIKHKGLFNDEPDGNSQIEKWLPSKLSQMQQLENFKLVCTLPGHIGLTAGMVVNHVAPNPQDTSVNQSPGPDHDFSGEYLITNLRRSFGEHRHTIVLEMVKDSRAYDPSATIGP